MRFPLLFALSIGSLAATPESVTISEGPRSTTYEVAHDEIGTFHRDGSASVNKAGPRTNAAGANIARSDWILYEAGRPRSAASRRWMTPKVLAQLAPGADAEAIATAVGAVKVELPPYAKDTAVFFAKDAPGEALTLAVALRKEAAVLSAEPLLAREHAKRLIPNDTYFSYNPGNAAYQWYLYNTGQNGGIAGVDINVRNVWDTRRGAGIRIGIVDEGIQRTHPDLAANVDLLNGYDWNEGDADPSSGDGETHGTNCAALAVARGGNATGISGAAPEATLVPLRLLSAPVTDLEEAGSLAWRNDIIHIKSSSWGPVDDGLTLAGPGVLAAAAIENGIATGRGGRGTIYLWSAGGGGVNDNSNFDYYANSVFAIGVGAVSDLGGATDYGEPGANILVSAPSSSSGRQGILTTDTSGPDGVNNGSLSTDIANADYTKNFGGTSASTPLVAGVVALMLEANPNLGWRDVKEILIRSAVKNTPADAGWANNGAGWHFHHKFGAGLIDAQAAVSLAATWTNLPAMTHVRKALTGIGAAIPDSPSVGVSRTISIAAAENLRVESVALEVGFSHASRGQLEIMLTSPSGTVSQLSTQRPLDTFAGLYWKYTSVRHWGESATGTWTVTVTDKLAGTTGTVNTAVLWLYGSASATTTAPVINSSLTASATQNSGFSYQMLALNSPTTFSATGLPAGVSVNSQTGLVSGTPTVAGMFNITLGATNAFGTNNKTLVLSIAASPGIALGDAVEQSGLTWLGTGTIWGSQTTTTHDGVDAAKSGIIGDSGTSTVRVYIDGPATLRFWWKVSSESDSDILSVSDNGGDLAYISGEVDWRQALFYLAPGSHRIDWTYGKDAATVSGSDAGWLDEVEVLSQSQSPPVFLTQPNDVTVPTGGTLALCTTIFGAQPITYVWRRGGVIIPGATSACYAVSPAGSINVGGYTCTATNAFGSATTTPVFVAVPSANGTLATATDNSLVWASYGNAPWASQATNTHDGVDAAKAGLITHLGSTTMATTVFGPGTLSFWWRVRSQEGADILEFYLDGDRDDYLTGTAGWLQVTRKLGPGAHLLEWNYGKDDTVSSSSDTGWVDQVAFTQSPYATWAATNFTLFQRVDLGVVGFDADANGDGVNNLLAYATGISPTAGSGTPTPELTFDGTAYALVYQKNTAATDLAFSVQRSSDLTTWTTVSTTDSVLSTNGALQTIKAVVPAVTGTQWYYRLRVTMP